MPETAVKAVLLTAGDPNALTGGSLFHRRIAERAPRFGVEIDIRALGRARGDRIGGADVVVVDSIVAARVRPAAISRPVVASVHQRPGGLAGRRPARAIRAALDVRLYRRAAAVVVPSDFLRRELGRAGVPDAIVRIVEPGSDPIVDRRNGAESADRGDERRSAVAFVTVANLSRHKRPFDLLDAFALLGDLDASLTIVGGTADRRVARRVRARLAERDLAGRARWTGPLSPDRVADVLFDGDVFVLPALDESYGIAVAEAMRAGLPAVVVASGNLPNLVRNGVAGVVVPPGDVGALAHAMRALAIDRARRVTMGEAARGAARRFPTWGDAAEAFCRVLTSVQSRFVASTSARRSAV